MRYKSFIVFLIFFTWSCTEKTAEKFTIGFSQCTSADLWRKTMEDDMKRELSFNPEINFEVKDAQGNSSIQIAHIQELIDQPIDLLIVSPNETIPITPIIEKAYNKGIPVIIIDRRSNSQKFTAYVGADNFEVGKNAGDEAKILLKGKGNVIEISGLTGSSPEIDRHNGFLKSISESTGIKFLTKINGNWERNSFEPQLESFLQKNSNVDLIFVHNDRMALGAYQVCKKLGLDKKIKIIGVDGLSGKGQGIDLVDRAMLSATILYPTGGEEAIRTAIDILKKKPFKKENILSVTVIDKNNVRITKLQNEKVFKQQQDIERRQNRIEEQNIITQNQSYIIYGISFTLGLAIVLGLISYFSLKENRKINQKLAIQNQEISEQKNQLIAIGEKAQLAHEAKLKFFTNISHEFKTPLTLILAPLDDILSSSKFKDANFRQDLLLIRKNTLRLLRLVNQLMDFRKVEGQKMQIKSEKHDLIPFLNEIMASFKKIAQQRNIDFRIICSQTKLFTYFDPSLLDKVIFNVLSNAFKFTENNGRIYLYLEVCANNQIQIKIEDTGIGMSAEESKHVFEVFYQAESNKRMGTGLGLALSKELITLHNGDIFVNSQKGKGTTFTILLPLIEKRDEKLEEIVKEEFAIQQSFELYQADIEVFKFESTESTSQQHSVLIIEDNQELIQVINRKLQPYFKTYLATDGDSGLRSAFENIPDLIISDIMLPGKDGVSLASILKTDFRTSHIPIILLTAKNSQEQQVEGIKAGVDLYITKPFNLEVLTANINTLIKNRNILREHYTSELPIDANGNPNKIDKKFINDFISYIEEHLGDPNLNVDEIGKQLGLSRVQLYRKVKALLNYSVNDYIQQVRLNKAKHLLKQDNMSIADIAFKVGFSSATYFSTAFKAKFNKTPLEYKNS